MTLNCASVRRPRVLSWTSVVVSLALASLLISSGCDHHHHDGPAPDTSDPGGNGTEKLALQVPRKFGLDANNNGVIDMPESVEYAQGPLNTHVDARRLAQTFPDSWPPVPGSNQAYGTHLGPWRWTFSEASALSVPQYISTLPLPTSSVPGLVNHFSGNQIVVFTDVPAISLMLYEGQYSIEVASVTSTGVPIYWKTSAVEIDDILIVQLGDSYSSGEGAPDRDSSGGYWGDDGTPAAGNGSHAAAHRSSLTWGCVYAQQVANFVAPLLSAIDGVPRTVTYLNLARSGAVIADVNTQLDEMRGRIGVRRVDTLLVSIGGNDVGLKNAIVSYFLREPTFWGTFAFGPDLDDIEHALRSGDWTGGPWRTVGSVMVQVLANLNWSTAAEIHNVRGLDNLAGGYQELANAFHYHLVDPENVWILQYPNPLVPNALDTTRVCDGPADTLSMFGRQFEIGTAEQQRARSDLIYPLNEAVGAAASAFGWRVIPAQGVMNGEAICQDHRYVNRIGDSQAQQGDQAGAFHPNMRGYAAIARLLWQ